MRRIRSTRKNLSLAAGPSLASPPVNDSPTRPGPRLAVAAATTLGLTATLLTQAPYAGGQPVADAPTARSAPVPAIAPAADKPNVLLVTVDDMEVSDLRRMPALRRIVARGTTVAQAVAPTPICAPARASMLTGQYAPNHGVHTVDGPHGGYAAFRDHDTVPVWLQRAGYTTHFAGKYLNGYGDRDPRRVPPGWDDWYGAVGGSAYSFYRTVFNDDGRIVQTREHNSDVLAEHTVDLVEDRAGARKPWFAWVNFTAPHHGGPAEPDDPPGVENTMPARRHRDAFRGARLPRVPEMLKQGGSPWAVRTADRPRKAALREAYQQRAESLLSVDEAMARIVATLRRTGQWKDTLLVFSSDNGYLVGHHNRTGKLVPYDRSLRIPFYLVGPGIPRGTTRTPTTVVDLPVTIAAIAGARPGRRVDGVDMSSYWRSGRDVERPIPIQAWPVSDGRARIYAGIRRGPLTYARLPSGREVLFDRSRDPGELSNVVRRAAYADEVRELRRLTRRYRDCRGTRCPGVETFRPG
jgi:arylsulfatase A-like enzyme